MLFISNVFQATKPNRFRLRYTKAKPYCSVISIGYAVRDLQNLQGELFPQYKKVQTNNYIGFEAGYNSS